METVAREIFRDVLAAHYIDGHPFGEEADLWLKTHGGWLPDPQEMYDDGTPLTQPRDEGDRVSEYPEKALKEAMGLMKCLGECDYEYMQDNVDLMDFRPHEWLVEYAKKYSSESVHGCPYDRGGADRYYGRSSNPHKWTFAPSFAEVYDLSADEIEAYDLGFFLMRLQR